MAKVYQCDACGKTINNPYEERMKEFVVACHFEVTGVFPWNTSQKVKVHLCDKCYHALHKLAEKETPHE